MHAAEALVRDVMTKDVVTVRSFASFRDITAAMLAHRIGAVPVVDSMGHAIGVVSRTDLIAKAASTVSGQAEAWERLSRRGRLVHERGAATTAAGLMATNLITVGPETGVSRAAYLMERHEVTHLPVVDARNRVVGIVSRSDLLGAYLGDDEELRGRVLEAVAHSALSVNSGSVEVQVLDGVVTLTGKLDHSAVAVRAIRGLKSVRGVVDVVDEIDWLENSALPGDAFDPGPLF